VKPPVSVTTTLAVMDTWNSTRFF